MGGVALVAGAVVKAAGCVLSAVGQAAVDDVTRVYGAERGQQAQSGLDAACHATAAVVAVKDVPLAFVAGAVTAQTEPSLLL